MEKEKSSFRRLTDKLYGGLNMSWLFVIVYAIGAAVIAFLSLFIPALRNTSIGRIGVHLEAWIFFAVIIMANCKKPLESATKTFVFFLVSQPLIYLFQVPFYERGWAIFSYYKYWFILTLLTFPAAYIGWYIKKKNWLSVLIFLPILGLLTLTYFEGFEVLIKEFPRYLLMTLFCIGQVLLYAYVFSSNLPQKLVMVLLPLLIIGAAYIIRPETDMEMYRNLPDEVTCSDTAVITVEDTDIADVSFANAEMGMVKITCHSYGSTKVTIQDGDKEYHYILEILKEDAGDGLAVLTIDE